MKLGRYASAPVYFSAYRTAAERLGYAMDDFAIRSVKDFTRSCLRGLGAPARPRPLPFEALIELPRFRDPMVSNGPINPRAAIVIGAWWLCREIELACLRARLVEVSSSARGVPCVAMHLPASKSDQLAVGLSRSLCCICSPAARAAGGYACPVCILLDHLRFLRFRFPGRWSAEGPAWDLPLFPTAAGAVVQKSCMADTVVEAARLLGVPREAPDGSERVTGHSLRVTGAQGLAQRGWDLWTIQLHGRWGSDVIKRYVRDSPLMAVTSGRRPSGAGGLDLEAVIDAVVSRLSPCDRVEPGTVRTAVCIRPCAGQPPLAEIASRLDAERSVRTEPEPLAWRFVLNTRSGTYHRRVAVGVSNAACGWSFGNWPHALVPDAEAGPMSHAQLCSRCWPSLLASAKSSGVLQVLVAPSSSSSSGSAPPAP